MINILGSNIRIMITEMEWRGGWMIHKGNNEKPKLRKKKQITVFIWKWLILTAGYQRYLEEIYLCEGRGTGLMILKHAIGITNLGTEPSNTVSTPRATMTRCILLFHAWSESNSLFIYFIHVTRITPKKK